jgi:hypothetical protein
MVETVSVETTSSFLPSPLQEQRATTDKKINIFKIRMVYDFNWH